MSKGFLKFKRKIAAAAILKSILFGVSLGALAFSLMLIARKLFTFDPKLLLCAAVGAGVTVISAVIAFIVLRPTDKRVAIKLDTELGLGEKVQTMLSFRNESGDVIELQRKDADERLLASPRGSVKIWHVYKHVIAPVLACALTVTAFIVPAKVVTPSEVPEEPDYLLSDWQAAALAELIEDVRKSEMEDSPKQLIITELEALLAILLDDIAEKESDVRDRVVALILKTREIADKANSYDEIGESLEAQSLTEVQRFGDGISALNGLKVRDELAKARESFKSHDTLAALLKDTVSQIRSALTLSGTESADALHAATLAFAAGLEKLIDDMPQYTQGWAQSELDLIFDRCANAVNNALLVQKNNKEVAEYTEDRLIEIFKVELPSDEKDGDGNGDGPNDENTEDDPLQDGGLGSGNIVYGSDDLIYYPDENAHIVYGNVINDCFSVVDRLLLDGNASDEMEKFIRDYFTYLYDGTENEK